MSYQRGRKRRILRWRRFRTPVSHSSLQLLFPSSFSMPRFAFVLSIPLCVVVVRIQWTHDSVCKIQILMCVFVVVLYVILQNCFQGDEYGEHWLRFGYATLVTEREEGRRNFSWKCDGGDEARCSTMVEAEFPVMSDLELRWLQTPLRSPDPILLRTASVTHYSWFAFLLRFDLQNGLRRGIGVITARIRVKKKMKPEEFQKKRLVSFWKEKWKRRIQAIQKKRNHCPAFAFLEDYRRRKLRLIEEGKGRRIFEKKLQPQIHC